MNASTDATTEELREQIATLRADFTKLSRTAANGVGDVAEDARDSLSAAGRKVARTGRDAREGVVEAVSENPLTAIGIAAGVGYLLGVLTRR